MKKKFNLCNIFKCYIFFLQFGKCDVKNANNFAAELKECQVTTIHMTENDMK